MEALGIIRYADDFIVTNESKEVIEQAKVLIEQWLAERGLELNQGKTKIVNIKDGFNFIGFKVRKYEVGKHRADKDRKQQYTGQTIFIEPSKDSERKHYRKLAEIIDKHKASNIKVLINELTPIIRGWCNYYQYCSGKGSIDSFYYTNKSIHWDKLQQIWFSQFYYAIETYKDYYFVNIPQSLIQFHHTRT